MPDYDPKIIPLLDDIIEDESDETASSHEKIIVTEEMQTDDSTLDMFNHATAEIDIAHNEPEIGTIEKHIDDETAINIEAIETYIDKTPDDERAGDETEVFESALIDYTHENKNEENFEPENDLTSSETETNDSNTFDEPDDQTTDITSPITTTEPLNTLNIDAIIDDVVSQILPELEQTLRTRLKQALQEQLPPDGIEPTVSE